MKKENIERDFNSTPDEEGLLNLEWVYYADGTSAYYDPETDTYYNQSGQRLRNPDEYSTNSESEGYTPFGDE